MEQSEESEVGASWRPRLLGNSIFYTTVDVYNDVFDNASGSVARHNSNTDNATAATVKENAVSPAVIKSQIVLYDNVFEETSYHDSDMETASIATSNESTSLSTDITLPVCNNTEAGTNFSCLSYNGSESPDSHITEPIIANYEPVCISNSAHHKSSETVEELGEIIQIDYPSDKIVHSAKPQRVHSFKLRHLPDVVEEREDIEDEASSIDTNESNVDTDNANQSFEHIAPPEEFAEGGDSETTYTGDSDSSDSSFEPVWASAVSKRGDLFYLEPGDPGASDPPQSILVTNSRPQENGDHASHKQKQGLLKKKVKKLIRPGKEEITETNNNNTKNKRNRSSLHPKGSVTFNDMPTGVLKEVTLKVDPSRHNYGRRASLCETLFGIVPGEFNGKSNGASKDKRIMVQGLLPGHEAIRSGEVKIGDWLMCVNDLEINSDNIDSILSGITEAQVVKLTLQKLAVQQLQTPIKKASTTNEQLIRIVSGQTISESVLSLENVPHIALYLKLDTDTSYMENQEDTLYQYPEAGGKLNDIRGLFTTLSHVMMDITDNIANNSTLLIDGKLVNVSFAREGRELFVFAMPAARVSLVRLNKLTEDIVRVIKVLYGSLHSAFSNKQSHGMLDHFFRLTFQRILLSGELGRLSGRQASDEEPFMELVPGVRALSLPEDVKVTISTCLGELESADFADMSEDYYDIRRSYVILGTCLFYKSYLIANHLPKEDLEDIWLYLHTHCLLALSHDRHLGQLVVWREVFPWRRCHAQTAPLLPGYMEMEARWFLLVVGMKTSMIAMLLEAGGCAAWTEGCPGPDPFYVDQMKATLLQLASYDVANHCEARLLSPPVPSLACVDWFFPAPVRKDDPNSSMTKMSSSTKIGVPATKKLLQPESILKKKGSPGSHGSQSSDRDRYQGRGVVYDVDSDVDSQSTGNSDSSTPIMGRRGAMSNGSDESANSANSISLFKGNKKKRNLLSAYDLTGLRRTLSDLPGEEGSLVKLTSGCDNTLFHYVHLDELDGIVVCPSQQELGQIMTPSHSKVLANFHQACISIRRVLQPPQSTKVSSLLQQNGRFTPISGLGEVREHGVLFHCLPDNWTDTKKSPPLVSYWVVGRVIEGPCPREFYVCFQDSAQQNVIELAFKLGFGLTV